MNKITDLYFLRCLTNTHVGSGDTTYGIVDKEVQRDVITHLPVIHSSGLKGSFRELMADIYKNTRDDCGNSGNDHLVVESIFGSEKQVAAAETKKLRTGTHVFHDAHTLAIPVRSNKRPFFIATAPCVIDHLKTWLELHFKTLPQDFLFLDTLKETVLADDKIVINQNIGNVRLEQWNALYYEQLQDIDEVKKINTKNFFDSLKTLLQAEDIAVFPDDLFKKLCNQLPVIARNNLDNGVSKNLWYEEVVPRESRFYFTIVRPAENAAITQCQSLQEIRTNGKTRKEWRPKEINFVLQPDRLYADIQSQSNELIQIGGNATIGYGLCQLERKYSSTVAATPITIDKNQSIQEPKTVML